MPTFAIQTPTGQTLDIEAADEATAINGAKQWHAENAPRPDIAKDVASSLDAGVAAGTAGLLGLPGYLTNQGARGIGAASDFVSDTLGLQRYQPPSTPGPVASALNRIPTPETMATEIQKRYYGGAEPYQPQTGYGSAAHSVGEMLPGVAGGEGSLLMKGAQAVGAGLGSEAVGNYFKGTALEPYARFVGGLVGGVGTAGGAKAVEGVRNYNAGRSTGAEIARTIGGEDVSPGAVRRVAQNVADEELTAPQAQARAAQLGPQAMLLDMGHQLEGRADYMAQSPGRAANTVYRPVTERVQDIPAQVNAVLDRHLGAPQNVVDLQNQVDAFTRAHVTPAYRHLEQNYPVMMDQTLQQLAQRPAIAEAMGRARGVAANYGETIDGATPSLRFWDYTKKAMDQRISGMMRTGYDDLASAQKADLGGLMSARRELVNHLDNLTQGEYQRVRNLAATKPQMEEALEFGRGLFNNRQLPEEVAEHVRTMSQPEQRMVQIGARREIENRVNAPGDEGRKLRALLSSQNNQDKLAALLGRPAADEIQRSVAAADHFQRVSNKIHNSRTATRIAGMNDTNAPTFNQNPTILGAASALPRLGINYALEHGMGNTRQDISRILTAKGPQINPVVEALLNYGEKRASNAATPPSQQMQTLVRALMSGTFAK